jgi:acyl-CoA reductase-like NAD-dependent aldehyde dehydrogenase
MGTLITSAEARRVQDAIAAAAAAGAKVLVGGEGEAAS